MKGVEYSEYEALKRTAAKVDTIVEERDHAEKKALLAEQRAAVAEVRAKEAMNERPSIKLQMECVDLRGRLERMERRLQAFMERLPQQIKSIIQNILNDREPFPKVPDKIQNRVEENKR